MKSCTFFGHADTPQEVLPVLKNILSELISNKNVGYFYVGVEGNFDKMCYRALKDLKTEFQFIKIYRVLAYMPKDDTLSEDSILPEGIEMVPKRATIPWRNNWMIKRSDYAVTYVTRIVGGAHKFESLAINRGLDVINIVGNIK